MERTDIAHGLDIVTGGSRLERFIYGWCPCGWAHPVKPASWAEDDIKRAFLAHLQGLGGSDG